MGRSQTIPGMPSRAARVLDDRPHVFNSANTNEYAAGPFDK